MLIGDNTGLWDAVELAPQFLVSKVVFVSSSSVNSLIPPNDKYDEVLVVCDSSC